MSTQWKIREFKNGSVWGHPQLIEEFQLNRPIIEILEQRDMQGEFLYIEAIFAPVENDPAEILNTPFTFAGVILEEI